jgi:uncharacterized protein with HEPN domain
MRKDNLIYIFHIRECLDKILTYTKNISQDDFMKDSLVHDAVIRNFEIIGEAAKNLTNDFKKKYADIEWKRIAGMRDKLIHVYIIYFQWSHGMSNLFQTLPNR